MKNTPPPLIGAPYIAPVARPGDWIDDEILGRLEVGGWTTAPISWPRRKKTGRASLILTAELVRAVKIESVEALCYWWGIGPTKAWMLRNALNVDQITEGTRLLKIANGAVVPLDAAARGRIAAATPEAIKKISTSKLGKPAPPTVKAGLLRAASAPKPPGWGKKANEWMLAGKEKAKSR